jgi:hypothetical protein
MDNIVLKQEIIKRIQDDPILFGKVAEQLDIKPVTLPRILYTSHKRLTLPGFVKFLSEELHMNQEDLLEVIPESGDNNNEESLQLQETH